jgi:hypothetical protein
MEQLLSQHALLDTTMLARIDFWPSSLISHEIYSQEASLSAKNIYANAHVWSVNPCILNVLCSSLRHIKVRPSCIESSVGSKHFVAIFKKSDIDISGCDISILDG